MRFPVIEALDRRMLLSSAALHVSGTHVVDAAGDTIRLRGVDVDSLEYDVAGDHILQSINTALQSWHANLIRLPMNENFWFGYDYSATQNRDGGAAYRALVDQIVNTISQSSAYVVLDLHWSDENVWGANNGQHLMPDDNSTLFWQSVAAKYANNPAVMFDLYNEPHNISWSTWENGGTISEKNSTTGVTTIYHSPGMQGLLDTVRAAGANNIVAASGDSWASDLSGITAGYALNDSAGNLMYQAHLYPSGNQTDAARDARVGPAAAKYAVYIGEFGTDPDGSNDGFVGQPTAAAWTQSMIAWLDRHQFNWTAWSFNPQTKPVLLSDWNYTPTPYYGAYVKASLAVPTPGPRVTAVAVSGAGWTFSPYSIPAGGQQLTDLPWTNLDQIRITFNENVSVSAGDLGVSGMQVASYAISGFTYNAATFTATWTLASPIGADHLALTLAGVRDGFGYALDGQWTDGVSAFPSGDGAAGGAFVFHFNVLPGDIDGDGSVDFNDLVLLARSYSSAFPFNRVDLNGDGRIDFDDLVLLARRYGQHGQD